VKRFKRTGAKDIEVVRAAHALATRATGYSEKFEMYAFLVTVEGMEPCEALALAYGHERVRHSRKGDCRA
jgi:hypothetical protein